MPVDDVMSSYENSVANNSALSIQPATDDEWLVTHFLLTGATATWDLQSHTNAEFTAAGFWGGSTAAGFEIGGLGVHQVRYLVSNSEYIRLSNRTAGTRDVGFSAIKTKD
jgi:hypothetical protein